MRGPRSTTMPRRALVTQAVCVSPACRVCAGQERRLIYPARDADAPAADVVTSFEEGWDPERWGESNMSCDFQDAEARLPAAPRRPCASRAACRPAPANCCATWPPTSTRPSSALSSAWSPLVMRRAPSSAVECAEVSHVGWSAADELPAKYAASKLWPLFSHACSAAQAYGVCASLHSGRGRQRQWCVRPLRPPRAGARWQPLGAEQGRICAGGQHARGAGRHDLHAAHARSAAALGERADQGAWRPKHALAAPVQVSGNGQT